MNFTKILILLFSFISVTYAQSSKVLLVVTNHSELGDTGVKTGYYLPEVTHPYYELVNAGYEVDFASPKGGVAPMDPKSKDLTDPENKAFYSNKKVFSKLQNTLSLKDIKASDYKAIVFAGGHGTMWDFANSSDLNRVTSEIYENGGIVSAVCHGPAALVNVKLSNGKYLVSGKKLTAFTNEEEEAVKLTEVMPFLLETELVKKGAEFLEKDNWKENVVVDGRLITGQNPASAKKLGKEIVKLLKENK